MNNRTFNVKYLFAILLVLICITGESWANSNTYYAKVQAHVGSATGSGTVYAATEETDNPQYSPSGNTTSTISASGYGSADLTFYLYAQANDGSEFTGWSETANGSEISNSNVSPFTYTVSSNSTNQNPTATDIYAIFRLKPTFYFSATATPSPAAGGTCSVSLTQTSVRGEHWDSESATTTATYSATPNTYYTFLGWSQTENGTIVSSDNPYVATITSNSTDSGNPTITNLYARFQPDPIAISVASSATVLLSEGSTNIPYVLSPSGAYDDVTGTTSDASIFTISAVTNGNATVVPVASGTAILTLTAHKPNGDPVSPSAEITIIVREQVATPVINLNPSATGETATATISCATDGATIYYTVNGADPTTSSTEYTGTFTVNNGDEIRAIAVKSGELWVNSEIATVTYSAVQVATPTISITSSGVTFSSETVGASFYYTTNGTTPTTSSTLWDGNTPITGLSDGTVITVIAAKNGMIPSEPATATYYTQTGVSDGVVTLNDFEDHTWTYYAGIDASIDDGNYNTNYEDKMYSPNPRNVKITYTANGGAVSIDEDEASFIYYKTLEEGSTSGEYPYTVISNPFSKRPTGMGFSGWKIVSGGEYIDGHANNDVLDLDEEITFVDLPYPSVNCTSAEIELQATWESYNNVTYASGNNITYSVSGGTYETNFLVLNRNVTGTITTSSPVTIMMVEPDGSADYRNTYTFTGNITPNNNSVTKIEFSRWNSTNTLNCNNHSVTVGRGMTTTSQCASYVTGVTGTTSDRQNQRTTYNSSLNYHLKLESGTFTDVSFVAGTEGTAGYVNCNGTSNQVRGTLGNDYDRAKQDNTKLLITDELFMGYRPTYASGNQNNATFICWVKSGNLCSETEVTNTTFNNQGSPNGGYYGDASQLFYASVGGTQTNIGKRTIYVEGGILSGIAGGIDENNNASNESFIVRMTGGQVRGVIYGSGAFAASSGIRRFIITGGTVNGWIAAGCNGTDPSSSGGTLPSDTYVYVGGTASVGNATDLTLNTSSDGNIFGAGSGNSAQATTGQVNNTNVVIADECYVKNNVYGGGNYGYSNATATVYVTGGEVGGSVYGGSNQKQGVTVDITMTGGLITEGLYGGSNTTGTISGNVTMQINGGQVGTSSSAANIHGGGYGQSTRVSGNIDITLGEVGQAEDGVVVYGDVYGGSALGYVNGTSASTTLHTNVTLNKGTINGSLFGGALGSNSVAANVYAPVTVTVTDGLVSSGVYGGCNTNGTVYGTTAVTISGGTIGAAAANANIYGGGFGSNTLVTKGATVLFGNTCNDYTTPIVYGDVYGGSAKGYVGGTAANDTYTTTVTIQGGTVTGDVYGGGHGDATYAADVRGPVVVNITGGKMTNVFGCNNANGAPLSTAEVNINIPSSCNSANCESDAADYNITGSIYGGGNAAAYSGTTQVTFTSGVAGDIFGGGLGAAASVVETNVLMSGGSAYRVFGGGNAAPVTGDTHVIIRGLTLICNNVYGGGNAAVVGGNTHVSIGE